MEGPHTYTYDAPDGELYCKDCFKKTFPTAEMPLIYSDTSIIKPAGEDGGCPRCQGAVFQVRTCSLITSAKSSVLMEMLFHFRLRK